MRILIALSLAAALSACSSFGNRLACTPGKDKAFVVSEYGGRIGFATMVDDRDKAAVCR